MEKIERDGRVAVLYSPGFGAGWSTWNREHAEALCMDARITGAFLDADFDSIKACTAAKVAALNLFPGIYTGGADDLEIEWVPKGSAFEIEEYDGNETVHIIGGREYMIA